MLRLRKNRKAQAIVSEYVLVLFLVVGVVTAMTVYFKRGVQARIRDAKVYMVNELIARTDNQYDGNYYVEYEPYYSNTVSNIVQTSDETSDIVGNGFKKRYNDFTSVYTVSETAPPNMADEEYKN